MNQDPAKFSLSNFIAGESRDPLQAPPSFTRWMQAGAWAVELYEPELLATADARTAITFDGKPRSVINLCSYNYLGLANHPEVIAAAHDALTTHGMGALGIISGLLRKADVAVLDNRSHLSLRDGATLSRCRSEKFQHNDPASLDASLRRHKGKRRLVVIEGIYSMDGDF